LTATYEMIDLGTDLPGGGTVLEFVDGELDPAGDYYDVHDRGDFLDFAIGSADAHQAVAEYYRDVTVDDRNWQRTWAAHTRQHKQLSLTKLSGRFGLGRPAWSSGDESIALVGVDGLARHVGDGTVTMSAVANGLTRTLDLTLSGVPDYEDIEQAPAVGSAREAFYAGVDPRIAGLTPSVAKPIFTTRDHTTPNYVRNTGCWAYDLDLTCISPWNSYGGAYRGGTLISPRHAIWAHHYPIADGSTLRFVTTDNQVVDRTVVSSQQIGSSDIRLGVLNEDVPDSIGFAKILPDDWADYLPNDGAGLPILSTDGMSGDENALVFDSVNLYHDIVITVYVTMGPPADATRLGFWEDLIEGDSGNPRFLVIGDELVLLAAVYSIVGNEPADAIVAYAADINAAMSGYQLTRIDLSGYTSYA